MIAWPASQCRKGPERAHRRKPSSSREGWAGTDPLSQGCILFHQSYCIVRLIENENLFHLQNHFAHGQNLKNHFDLNVSVGHPAVPFLRTRSDKATLLGHSARSFLTVPGASPSPGGFSMAGAVALGLWSVWKHFCLFPAFSKGKLHVGGRQRCSADRAAERTLLPSGSLACPADGRDEVREPFSSCSRSLCRGLGTPHRSVSVPIPPPLSPGNPRV